MQGEVNGVVWFFYEKLQTSTRPLLFPVERQVHDPCGDLLVADIHLDFLAGLCEAKVLVSLVQPFFDDFWISRIGKHPALEKPGVRG